MFHSRYLFYAVLVILGTSVICHSPKEHREEKETTAAENEGSSVQTVRDRRDVQKSNVKIGFFTEIHCRRLHHWLNHGKGGHAHKFRDCQDILKRKGKGWSKSGVRTIHPKVWKPVKVYCDMKTAGGGWTVFQHRFDGSVNFYRTWSEYKTGFGNPRREFWLGNENIHILSNQGKYKLRILMEDFSGNRRYAEYSSFVLSSENEKYRLNIGSYKGTAGYDALAYHNKMKFTTKDADNDAYSRNCALYHKGGWWYKSCQHCNLNGLYHNGKDTAGKYNRWNSFATGTTNMKSTTMMIRKV